MNEKVKTNISLQVIGVTKFFPGVKALDNINLEIRKGEVHALCGENGAGKSTLMKVLTGNQKPEEGKILIQGEEVIIKNQKHAKELGISIVYQERSLTPTLSVAENIFVENQPKNRLGLINRNLLHNQTREILAKLDLEEIDPNRPVNQLSSAHQQMVEIAKALVQNPEILILDEPTASITEKEVKTLFTTIRQLSQQGVSIIYISHRMAELFEIADRVSVLKDGKHQGTAELTALKVEDIIRMMVGRDLKIPESTSSIRNEVVLETKDFSGSKFRQVNFKLRKGEILALAGLVGAGRTEVARAIIGADAKLSGKLILNGKLVEIHHPADAIKNGIGYLPEDRKEQGLFPEMTVEENILIGKFSAAVQNGFLKDSKARLLTEHYITQLKIATPDTKKKVLYLSGGNQQKVIFSRWLLAKPDIFIVDEPTHGVDVGAKSEIYAILKELAAQGVAILLISSELPEVLTLSDRILVMCNGHLTGELSREEASEESIMHYASL